MIVKKAREIKNARIEFVSLVDRAANKKRFLITKSADNTADFLMSGKILKADSETHHITGIVYEPMTEDAHGDFMTAEEIQKAAYWFAKNGDKVDRQHNFKPLPGAAVVETWIAKSDTEIAGTPIRKGTWLITVETEDPSVWEAVQKNEITGFSMGGVGEYGKEDIPLETLKSQSAEPEKASVLKRLAGWLGIASDDEDIEKAGKKISGRNYASLKHISEELSNFIAEFDEQNLKEDSEVVQEEIQKMVDTAVAKALGKSAAKVGPLKPTNGDNLTVAEVEKMVDVAVEKVFSLTKAEPAPAEKPEITMETVREMVNEAVRNALKPEEKTLKAEDIKAMVSEAVTKAVEPILKARGMSSNLNEEAAVEKKEERHYLAGIL